MCDIKKLSKRITNGQKQRSTELSTPMEEGGWEWFMGYCWREINTLMVKMVVENCTGETLSLISM